MLLLIMNLPLLIINLHVRPRNDSRAGVAFWQQATGVEAAVYYTPETLEAAGITDESMLVCPPKIELRPFA